MRIKHINIALGVRIFSALADDSRIRLLNIVRNFGPVVSADAELVLEFTQTKTSRHLSYLKNAGLLNSRKVERWVLWTVPDEVADLADDLLRRLEKDPELIQDIRTYRIMFSNRELVAAGPAAKKWQTEK
ncbi:MAG: ArsR family transcriptional regulator [Bacteroidota bacterium]